MSLRSKIANEVRSAEMAITISYPSGIIAFIIFFFFKDAPLPPHHKQKNKNHNYNKI